MILRQIAYWSVRNSWSQHNQAIFGKIIAVSADDSANDLLWCWYAIFLFSFPFHLDCFRFFSIHFLNLVLGIQNFLHVYRYSKITWKYSGFLDFQNILQLSSGHEFQVYYLYFYSCVSTIYTVSASEAALGGGPGSIREARGVLPRRSVCQQGWLCQLPNTCVVFLSYLSSNM